jgi:hypothetical protein
MEGEKLVIGGEACRLSTCSLARFLKGVTFSQVPLAPVDPTGKVAGARSHPCPPLLALAVASHVTSYRLNYAEKRCADASAPLGKNDLFRRSFSSSCDGQIQFAQLREFDALLGPGGKGAAGGWKCL